MPELKNNFTRGRMNKDLDDRLVPKGEYRDATNIQVSTSEGSDVGAIESVLGNSKIASKPGGGNWANDFGLSNPETIGVCVDTKNEKIYWFIVADNRASAVIEYDQTTNIVTPVLVDIRSDANNVLNFSKSNLITGVNIIDGLLFWTDNLNEPCRINIETFKAGSTQTGSTLSTTTVLFSKKQNTNIAVALDDITVIKKSPQQAPGFELRSSLIGYFDVPGLGRIPLTTQGHNFRDTNGQLDFGSHNINFDSAIQQAGIFIGKEIELTTSFRDKKNTVKIYIKATVTGRNSAATIFSITPSIIPSNIPNKLLTYDVRVIEDDYIYKKSFPRFSYRWKYNDGEYSTYAPFTEALFLPGKYNYNGIDAENKAMLNHLRQISLTFPDRETTLGPPRDVESIEVLYKPSNNNNIYVIKTASFKTGDAGFTRFTFEKELDGPVIESSQMLRLFDAVPKKALAQEIIGNRIVYGNYKEGYDTSSEIAISPRARNDQPPAVANSLAEAIGNYSIKSNREYQIGVAFLDDFGRESPVITDQTGAVSLSKEDSVNVNRIEASITSDAPSWAKMYKYYLKNNYSTSYNLMLDRFYNDEDGNVWLSFPSSERNKIDEKDTLILKKKHGNSEALFFDNEYKVIDIKNEPPEYLRINNLKPAARALVEPNGTSNPVVSVGETKVTFKGPNSVRNASFYREIGDARAVQFVGGTEFSGEGKSKIYSIKSAGPGYSDTLSHNLVTYKMELAEPLEAADAWVGTVSNDSTQTVEVILYSSDEYFSSEYIGRFFVKIEKLGSFETDIVEPSQNAIKLNTYITQRTPVESKVNIGIGTSSRPQSGEQIYDAFIPTLPATPFTLVKINRVFDYTRNDFYDRATTARVAQIGFTHASDTGGDDFTEIPLANGSNTFTLIYGPTNASINQIQDFTDELKTGNLIGFGKDGETSHSYIMTEVTDSAEITYNNFKYDYVTVTLDRNYSTTEDFPIADINALRILEQDLTVPMTDKPAIFEIKAEKNVDLDIYYEASDAFEIADLNKPKTLNYKNCIAFGNGIESTRIGDDFNAPEMGKGVRVSSVLLKPIKEEHKASSLIFSGIINSRSGVNDSNQFLIAENITKDLNSIYGSIQKLSTRGAGAQGDLLTLCEDKCFRILANKDALFNADGNANLTSTNTVLGQAIPFAGEYGISKNPESFASFGFRSYFTDKARGAILRLSADGLTDISAKGMSDFFQDKLSTQTGNYIGSYDKNTSAYIIGLGNECYSFKEGVDGWNTRLTYKPEMGASLNNIYYTYKTGEIFKHTNTTRCQFYGTSNNTSVTTLLNDNPSKIKNFKTVLYEGDTGWQCTVSTNENNGFVYTGSKGKWGNIPGTTADARDKEGIYYGWIRGNTLDPVNNTVGEEFAMQGIGAVSSSSTVDDKFSISFGRPINVSLQIGDTVYFINSSNEVQLAGTVFSIHTDRTTITVDPGDNGVLPEPPRFVFFVKDNEINTSGIIGYYAELTFTNPLQNKNELFAVGSEIFISS